MFFKEEDNVLELLGVFKLSRKRLYRESVDGRAYDSLSIRLSGCCEFKYKKQEICVKPSDLLYIPQNIHYSQSTEGETIIAIHFLNYSSAGKNDFEILHLEEADKFKDIICQMYRIWNEKETGYKNLCTSMLYQVVYMANQQMSRNVLPSDDLNKIMNNAVNFMHKNYKNEQISISELARLSSVSETYFRRLFKKIYLISPVQYIINLRLEYASQLLLSKLYSIKEVSEKSGFNDVKYFSRLFKRKFGKTPREYVKAFYNSGQQYHV